MSSSSINASMATALDHSAELECACENPIYSTLLGLLANLERSRELSTMMSDESERLLEEYWKVAKESERLIEEYWKVAKESERLIEEYWKIANDTALKKAEFINLGDLPTLTKLFFTCLGLALIVFLLTTYIVEEGLPRLRSSMGNRQHALTTAIETDEASQSMIPHDIKDSVHNPITRGQHQYSELDQRREG